MTLPQAIDDLIEFVMADERVQPDARGAFCRGILQSERHQFDELDRRVFTLAFAAGLNGELPKPVDIEGSAHVPDAPPIGFLGKTHLPGNWIDGVFSFFGEERWRRELLLVRTLAKASLENTDRPSKASPIDEDPFVPVSKLWPSRSEFKRASDVTKFLARIPNEPAPAGIRNRPDGPRRRSVNELDWHRYFREKDRQASELLDDEALQEQIADTQARMAEEHERKKQKRKEQGT
jgi:hypothetical protein